MKKILLATMVAAIAATGVSAGRLTNSFTYEQAKKAYSKLEKVSAECVGTSVVPYAGAAACGGILTELRNDKDIKKVVSKSELEDLKNLGVTNAATFWLPFASVGFGAKAADKIIHIKKDMRKVYPKLGEKIPKDNDNTHALKHYRG